MKNIKLATLLTLLLSLQLFSQDNNTKEYNLGLNLGANLFDLNQNDTFDTYDGVISYTFGLSLEYKINGKLSLLSNVNYDNKTMRLENFRNYRYTELNGYAYLVEDKIKFNYINIPLNIRYHIGQNNKLFTNIGVFYNHLLNLKNITTRNDTGEEITLFDYQNIIKKYDYGISFGIGYKFNLSNNNFSIEIKDELGLANIADYQNTSLTDLKTNTIKLILNWELPL